MKPLVSVLIPVYNRFDMVVQAIDSALAQTYDNIEIIVGDNHSTDGTYDRLYKKYITKKQVIVFQNKENLGPVLNWIECLKHARGNFIKILWSDDIIAPTFISEAMEILCCRSDVSFAFSKVSVFKDDNIENIVKKDCYSLGSTGIYDAKYFFNALVYDHNAPYSPGCAVFRKDSLKVLYSFSGSDEVQVLKTGAGVDLLMFLLALERKPKFYYINKTLCFFRWHSGSITVSNQMVPMGYMCALKYFFEKYNYFKYIKWIRVENRLFALKKRLLKKGIPGDVFNYYQKIKMIETGLCNFNIYVSVIACYIRRKLTNN